MEWVETTAKSLEEAKGLALDQLGVAADEAEFEVLEEPRSGLFGRTRGEARVRARVMPTAVRPKQERRGRGRKETAGGTTARGKGSKNAAARQVAPTTTPEDERADDEPQSDGDHRSNNRNGKGSNGRTERTERPARSKQQKASKRMDDQDERNESPVAPEEVGQAAVAFMDGLACAFGAEATTELDVDGTNLEVRVLGADLGLMVGPGGRTLMAVQDLARVASQRRLGDHDTRLRIDVGGYREKRRESLERFAAAVAAQVIESGTAKALEPMASSDRKTVHDAIVAIDGVTSYSDGEDPNRRVIIRPE